MSRALDHRYELICDPTPKPDWFQRLMCRVGFHKWEGPPQITQGKPFVARCAGCSKREVQTFWIDY